MTPVQAKLVGVFTVVAATSLKKERPKDLAAYYKLPFQQECVKKGARQLRLEPWIHVKRRTIKSSGGDC